VAANPVITCSPPNPTVGQAITLTVVYSPRVVFTATDQDGLVGTFQLGSVGLAAPGRTITKVSDNGSTAVFTTTY
jgi:hypothetical protein